MLLFLQVVFRHQGLTLINKLRNIMTSRCPNAEVTVYYPKGSDFQDVKRLVLEREPVNIGMRSSRAGSMGIAARLLEKPYELKIAWLARNIRSEDGPSVVPPKHGTVPVSTQL